MCVQIFISNRPINLANNETHTRNQNKTLQFVHETEKQQKLESKKKLYLQKEKHQQPEGEKKL